jgi:acetyltransferase-like isoleucine patch superfamily enzyme
MSIVSEIGRRLPATWKTAFRPVTEFLAIGWRRMFYAVRFAGLNVRIHPTSWVASKAIIRCTGGGEIVIGQGCEIHAFAMIDACGGSVRLGDYCSLNPFAIVYGHGGAKIGSHVRIAAHTVIIPANHNFRSTASLHESGVTGVGITIGDDVWLGAGARVLDGVSIGNRSVVGAGAVVTRSVPSGCVAKGVPARAVPIDGSHAAV